jgi:hypothetical protein
MQEIQLPEREEVKNLSSALNLQKFNLMPLRPKSCNDEKALLEKFSPISNSRQEKVEEGHHRAAEIIGGVDMELSVL